MTDYKDLCYQLTEELALYFRLSKVIDDSVIKEKETYRLLLKARTALKED